MHTSAEIRHSLTEVDGFLLKNSFIFSLNTLLNVLREPPSGCATIASIVLPSCNRTTSVVESYAKHIKLQYLYA